MTTTRSIRSSIPRCFDAQHPFKAALKNTLGLLAVFLGLSHVANAGSALNSTRLLTITVNDGTNPITVDTSNILTYNPATGEVKTPDPGAPVTGWNWSSTDIMTDAVLAQPVLTWHSNNLTADNTTWTSWIQLKAIGNVDPFLSYSFSAKNTTNANQTYSFSYGESIVPPFSGAYSITSDLGGSLTHGTISPSAQLTPTLGDFDGDGLLEIQTLKLSTDGGVTFVNAGVDLGTAQSRTRTGTQTFSFSDGKTGNLTAIDYWQFDTAFTLTPGKDAVGLSGFAEISAISEPSSYVLILSTLVLGGMLFGRRQFVVVSAS